MFSEIQGIEGISSLELVIMYDEVADSKWTIPLNRIKISNITGF